MQIKSQRHCTGYAAGSCGFQTDTCRNRLVTVAKRNFQLMEECMMQSTKFIYAVISWNVVQNMFFGGLSPDKLSWKSLKHASQSSEIGHRFTPICLVSAVSAYFVRQLLAESPMVNAHWIGFPFVRFVAHARRLLGSPYADFPKCNQWRCDRGNGLNRSSSSCVAVDMSSILWVNDRRCTVEQFVMWVTSDNCGVARMMPRRTCSRFWYIKMCT